MSRIVRVANGYVVEVFETMPVFHPDLMAQIRVDAPADVEPNWAFDGTAYSAPPGPLPPTERDYLFAVQAALDGKAQERHYDNIVSACSYAGSAVMAFDAESVALKAWRDEVWLSCYAALEKIEAGQVPRPSITEFIATLPQFTWPS